MGGKDSVNGVVAADSFPLQPIVILPGKELLTPS